MFLCLQMDDYKHVKNARGTRPQYVKPGKRAIVYRVELGPDGRPVWVLHVPTLTWAAGYADDEKKVKALIDRRHRSYVDLPWIATARHRKPVTLTEAARLLADRVKAGAPKQMCLDMLTELVSDQKHWEPAPVVVETEAE